MKNKAKIDFPKETVYQVIAELIIDNANAYTEGKENFKLEDLETLKYSYITKMQKGEKKNKVKVTKIIPNELLQYRTSREKMEKYIVTFQLTELSAFRTQLDYGYDLEGASTMMAMNHQIVGFFYKIKQNKGFKKMVKYITMKCEEKEKLENDKR